MILFLSENIVGSSENTKSKNFAKENIEVIKLRTLSEK